MTTPSDPQGNAGAPGDERKSAEQRGFETIGRVSKKGGKPFRPLIDRLFSRWVSSAHLNRDWATDADWARMQQEPMRAKALLYLVVLAIMGLIVWAGFAEVAEVTKGEGRVVPSSDIKVIQSFDGGMVDDIFVDEGQLVEKGDLLMRIDPTRATSSLREGVARSLALQAKAERLRALTSDQPFELPPEVIEKSAALAEHERRLFETSQLQLQESQQIAREQLRQRENELREARARYNQAARAVDLAGQELEMTRPLLASGAASEVEILRLQRELSNARGERGQASAQMARIEGAIDEAESKLREVELEIKNDWRKELSETLSQLAALQEGNVGLLDRVQSTEIRSPVKGIVQQLFVTTLGGVVQAGQEVVEIVPSEDQLVVEAHIAPRDIAFLHPGQEATVKFTAYDFSIYGGMEAVVTHISADTITNEQDETFYIVRVRTLQPVLGEGLSIIPGMTTQVGIRTGERTVLEYLLHPIIRAKNNAFDER